MLSANMVNQVKKPWRVNANMVTTARIVLMPIPGYLLYGGYSQLLTALFAIIILGLTDWLDGIIARREGTSALGGLLDPIADKIFIAVIYLPLTERGVVPVWMTACIFAREFLVTTLRTSLSLRDAPMHTSRLAKFKTAAQMIGSGYVILYLAHHGNPNAVLVWILIIGPIALPLGLMAYRLVKGEKQGLRSITMAALMTGAVLYRIAFGQEIAIQITLWIVTAFTIVSGFSYMMDAWSALRGKPGSHKELLRFILDGLLVPVSFIMLLGRYETIFMSTSIILIITLELVTGGLGNLLAGLKIVPRFRWMALKSCSQIVFAGAAFVFLRLDTGLFAGQTCIVLALIVSAVYTVVAFWRNRAVYLAAI